MEQFFMDFLTKQIPLVIVLGLFCLAMYKYFTAVIDKKDLAIEEKDEEIKELHKEMRSLTIQCLDAFNKNSDVVREWRAAFKNR